MEPACIDNAAKVLSQHDIHGELLVALHTYLEAVDYRPANPIAAGLSKLTASSRARLQEL